MNSLAQIKEIVDDYVISSGNMFPMKFCETKDEYYLRMICLIYHQNKIKNVQRSCSESHDRKQKFNINYSGPYGGKFCTKCNTFFH